MREPTPPLACGDAGARSARTGGARRWLSGLTGVGLSLAPLLLVSFFLVPTGAVATSGVVPSLSLLPGVELGKVIETTLALDNVGTVPATSVHVQLSPSDGSVLFGGTDNDATCSASGSSLTCIPYGGTLGTGNGRHWQHEVDPRALATGADGRIVLRMVVTWVDDQGAHSAATQSVVSLAAPTPTPTPTPTSTPTASRTPSPSPTRHTSPSARPTPISTAGSAGSSLSAALVPTVAVGATPAATDTAVPSGTSSSSAGSAQALTSLGPQGSGAGYQPVTITRAVVPVLGASILAALIVGVVQRRRTGGG